MASAVGDSLPGRAMAFEVGAPLSADEETVLAMATLLPDLTIDLVVAAPLSNQALALAVATPLAADEERPFAMGPSLLLAVGVRELLPALRLPVAL